LGWNWIVWFGGGGLLIMLDFNEAFYASFLDSWPEIGNSHRKAHQFKNPI
jgi:hypothetical protein